MPINQVLDSIRERMKGNVMQDVVWDDDDLPARKKRFDRLHQRGVKLLQILTGEQLDAVQMSLHVMLAQGEFADIKSQPPEQRDRRLSSCNVIEDANLVPAQREDFDPAVHEVILNQCFIFSEALAHLASIWTRRGVQRGILGIHEA